MTNEFRDGTLGELLIYTDPRGGAIAEVRLIEETLWLTEKQMSDVFERDRTVIGRHIAAIFSTAELEKESNVQKMHFAHSAKPVQLYSLDVVLSVGYRVNSKRGTQFRIWANRVLKDHLIKGFSIDRKKLTEQEERLRELKESIRLVERSLITEARDIGKARTIVRILADFADGLDVLDAYDRQSLQAKGSTSRQAQKIDVDEFLQVVAQMGEECGSGLFGVSKHQSFESSVGQIYQTFDDKELYPTIEEKAAMLLYLVVKNHSFVDGNKRIAAALFLYFLDRNGILFSSSGRRILGDDGLAALTLLIAVSKPEEKDIMVRILVTILNNGQR